MARPSPIAQRILELMSRGGRHAGTLEEITTDPHAASAQADFSSVYRAVERMVADGRLIRVGMDDGSTRFEPAGEHHDHLRCVRCNAVEAIPCVLGHADLDAIEARTGFAFCSHNVVLDGLCPACRQS